MSVGRIYIGPKSRIERLRKLKFAEVAHVTHVSRGHHFHGQKVKGQLAEAGHMFQID